jgi:hypothetical protein
MLSFLYKLYRLALVVCHSLIRLLMAAEVTSVLCITMPSLSGQWLVPPHQMLHTKHGIFVCVDARNFGLRNLVVEKNPLCENKGILISSLQGYALLRQQRNDLTAALDGGSVSSCTLFDACPAGNEVMLETQPLTTTPPKKRKMQVTGGEPGVVEIEVTMYGSKYNVVALQNKTPRDKLFVESSPANIHQVITLLRNSGKDAQLYKARDPTLPRGVWQRGGRYVVHKDGTNKYKFVNSLEAAQEFLGQNDADVCEVEG